MSERAPYNEYDIYLKAYELALADKQAGGEEETPKKEEPEKQPEGEQPGGAEETKGK